MDPFFHWLSSILFTGGGFSDAAIAEGLAEALMMLSIGNRNQNMNGKRHCILVAASNPYPLPTPVYRPQTQHIDQSDDAETPSDNHLSDAEALAKSFAQCAISLSVICPKNLPKLKAIYDAGKSDPLVADPPEGNDVKNPHFLVLISDNFMEARAALSTSGVLNLPSNQNTVKIEVTPGSPTPISGPPPASVTPGMSQPTQTGIQPLTLTEIEAGKPRNVKFWEGKLSGRPKGQLVQLARIEGFRDATEPDTALSSNWPETLEIAGLISQDDRDKMLIVGKAKSIVSNAMDEHVQLLELQENKRAGLIRLPSQTLLVTCTDQPHILLGNLLPGFQDTFIDASTTPAETSKPNVEEKPAQGTRQRKSSKKVRRR